MIDSPAPSPYSGRRWPWRLAVFFIVATLAALVIVPYLVHLRVERLRDSVRVANPARTMVMSWQYQLAREVVALSEMVLTGDSTPLAEYESAYEREREIVQELERLAAQLGPDVNLRYMNARTVGHAWHIRIDEKRIRAQPIAGHAPMRIPKERQLIDDMLRSVTHVDESILRAMARSRTQIYEAERQGMQLSTLLGFLMLLAGGAVITLESRMRRFAHEAETRRAEAAEALAESARVTEARERLLRGITHDVKNPLGAAKGYAELLEMEAKAPLAPEQKPLVEGVMRSVDNALAIIADLFDLARADSTGMSLEREECDLSEVVRDAAADHDAAARAAGHTLEAEVPGPIIAHTDPVRVRQVLDNLLSNAIKFTPKPGRISVRAATTHDNGNGRQGTWAKIEVSDTGPGIPPDKREAVFDEFIRLDSSASAEGHGLGLSIARGLSRRLGGDLTIADSETGARFVLRIPQRDGGDDPMTHANRYSKKAWTKRSRKHHESGSNPFA